MHDVDRILAEVQSDEAAFETDAFEFPLDATMELSDEADGSSPLSEVEEMDEAASLLEVRDDAELDQFLGGLIKKAGKFMKSPTGRLLGGALKKIAKKALPLAAKAAGGFFGGPAGAMIGGQLAGSAANMFELELEGMSPEDQEFEVAKKFVKFAATAAKNAAQTPAGASPMDAVKNGLLSAAKQHAPGLLGGSTRNGRAAGRASFAGGHSGRWIRRGNRIIIIGV